MISQVRNAKIQPRISMPGLFMTSRRKLDKQGWLSLKLYRQSVGPNVYHDGLPAEHQDENIWTRTIFRCHFNISLCIIRSFLSTSTFRLSDFISSFFVSSSSSFSLHARGNKRKTLLAFCVNSIAQHRSDNKTDSLEIRKRSLLESNVYPFSPTALSPFVIFPHRFSRLYLQLSNYLQLVGNLFVW